MDLKRFVVVQQQSQLKAIGWSSLAEFNQTQYRKTNAVSDWHQGFKARWTDSQRPTKT
jgi:hypothetical protein